MSLQVLQSMWFVLVFILLIGYAILDGFDLGVGVLHIFAKDDHERRIGLNAIGPVWDGNEVWLVTAGGALFAAFPAVYATVFSGFYNALVLLLAALIGRAVALEFRSKLESEVWKRFWDFGFFLGSAVAAVLFGVAFGNILRGVPIDVDGNYTGTFIELLNPFALLVGVLTLVTFTMHGALYLAIKSEGAMRDRLQRIVPWLWILVAGLYFAATGAAVWFLPYLFERFVETPWMWGLAVVGVVAIVATYGFSRSGKLTWAFAASATMIGCMVASAGASLYPRLVPSLINLNDSLTISNSSSSQRTLGVMLVVAGVGMPLVVGYSIFVYRVFKGKVVLSEESY
ncbi:MAG: cytochrome d ubiquinol oxidase subunit II [Planctomycetota bacterium]|nr:cytochrome d ubiquinol oxidase subunit II [Planctomycetota bacterium]